MVIPNSYLLYHPKRQRQITVVGSLKIHHDKFGGNEDPYLWNKQFLHTYCHITQLSNEVGQVNFWVSNDSFKKLDALYCNCVFVIAEKCWWKEPNFISRKDKIVENDQTFEHHYKWHIQHPLKRRRYTLKADSTLSFQPQDSNGNLIDILPFLNSQGFSTSDLSDGMKAGFSSNPFELGASIGLKLYEHLVRMAPVKILGKQIAYKHTI
jgi:hypothetical protein